MKKYKSLAEMESDQKQQRRKENRAIIAAMTDNELSATLDMIVGEQQHRKIDDEITEKNKIATSSCCY